MAEYTTQDMAGFINPTQDSLSINMPIPIDLWHIHSEFKTLPWHAKLRVKIAKRLVGDLSKYGELRMYTVHTG